ncbi:type II secretion system F family protein [bacterium CPR1]|nr:type II secretion system F family protein [bacterium CPR1]
MATFRYRASGAGGALKEGVLEATSKQDASRSLLQRGLMVLELKEERAATRQAVAPPVPPRALVAPPPRLAPRLSAMEAAVLFRQLTVMFQAGLPLFRAVTCLAQQSERPRQRQALDLVAARLAEGSSLSQAMARSGLFSPLEVGVMKAGEESGMLSVLLERLARLQELELAFQQQVKARLSYPVGVAAAMVVAASLLTILMGRVVASMGSLAEASPFLKMLQQPWLPAIMLLVPLALAWLAWWGWSGSSTRASMERVLLRTAVVGPLLRRAESARICRVLAVLASSGLRVDLSLSLTAGTTGSPLARGALEVARRQLAAGEGLAAALAASGYFPREVIQMTAAGESAGRLGPMLSKVAEYADQQVTHFLEAAVTALEPLLLSVLGFLVGLTMLAIFGPLYGALGRL